MEMPFSMLYEEFKMELANLINKSALPPVVVETILQNYLYEVNTFAKNRLQMDKHQYEKSLLEQSNNDSNKDDEYDKE